MQSRLTIAASVGRGIQRMLEGLAALALFAMMLLTTVDVGGRYFFGQAVIGAVELTQILMASLVFLAFPLVCWREEHVTIDLLDPVFPRAWIWIRQLLINLVCTVALWIMARRIWMLAERAFEWNDVTQYLRIPMGYLMVLMTAMAVFAGLLTLLRGALYLMEGLGLVKAGGPLSAAADRAGEGRGSD